MNDQSLGFIPKLFISGIASLFLPGANSSKGYEPEVDS
jgi:hypothetical protein